MAMNENIPGGNEQPRRHKGGAPKKKIRREKDIRVRLTATERMLIEAKAKEAGMIPSVWFRAAAKKAQVVRRLTPEDIRILRMLAGLANNVNQITRLAHKDGLIAVHQKCKEILAEVDQALKYLNNDDRKSNDR